METKTNVDNVAPNASANVPPSGKFKFIQLLNPTGFDKHFQKLIGRQTRFVYLLDKCFKDETNCVICVSGCAGAGKTFTVVETCRYVNAPVLKLAPTNALASQIGGLTLHAGLELRWHVGSNLNTITESIKEMEYDPDYIEKSLNLSEQIRLHELSCTWSPKIVIVDEVGMIPFWLIYQIVRYFFDNFSPVIVVLMGDRYQLRPVNCKLNIFNVELPAISIRHCDLSDINKRFDPSYKVIMDTITALIQSGEGKGEGIAAVNFQPVYDYVKRTYPQIEYMTETDLRKAKKILAYTNATVSRYNRQYLSLESASNVHLAQVREGVMYKDVKITVRPRCEVITTRPTVVPKGTRLTFVSYDPNEDALECLDDDEKRVVVQRHKQTGMFPIELAFATTVHKYQGSTIDEDVIMDFDYNDDVYFMYTALSRVRSLSQVIGILHVK